MLADRGHVLDEPLGKCPALAACQPTWEAAIRRVLAAPEVIGINDVNTRSEARADHPDERRPRQEEQRRETIGGGRAPNFDVKYNYTVMHKE